MTALDDRPATRTRRRADCGHDRPHYAHGYCWPCYWRWNHAGRPEDGPPPAWDCYRALDPVIVEIASDPRTPDADVPALTHAERTAAALILTARGWSAARIGRRLHCAERSVVRYRTAHTRKEPA